MQTIEYAYTDVNKARWGEGPWLHEPDKVQWLDEESGLPCVIKRNHSGVWCGYVGVPRSHPYYGVVYGELEHLDVHGGLTYSGKCQPHDPGLLGEAHAICHVVEPGEDDDIWWLGFDCGHGFDYVPSFATLPILMPAGYPGATYKDREYVTKETLQLARQVAASE